MRLKKRIFELLGIRPFQNGWADGLQVLRYNRTKAYNSHYDYLEYTPGSRLDSSRPGGANRCVASDAHTHAWTNNVCVGRSCCR